MNTGKVVSLLGAVAAAALLLSACKAEEQGRLLKYEPGKYLGKKDAEVSDAMMRVARNRVALQGSGTSLSGGRTAPSSRASNVRPPE